MAQMHPSSHSILLADYKHSDQLCNGTTGYPECRDIRNLMKSNKYSRVLQYVFVIFRKAYIVERPYLFVALPSGLIILGMYLRGACSKPQYRKQ